MKTSIISSAFALLTAAAAFSGCSEAEITPVPALDPSFGADAVDAPGGPFPSDEFTVADPEQKTGRRVRLSLPDCAAHKTDCEDVEVLNTLDGFNLQPRLSIPFDGPIDPSSVTSKSVFLIRLGDPSNVRPGPERRIGINQIVWDPTTNTLHAESDELLDQSTRYALVVTRAVRDASGAAIKATQAMRGLREERRADYERAVHAAALNGIPKEDVALASVFTTQSATAILEKIRDQVRSGAVERADFDLGQGGGRTVFDRRVVDSITWSRQMTPGGALSRAIPLNVGLLDVHVPVESNDPGRPGAVGRIAFGKFLSPDYMVHPGEFIPPVPTGSGVPVPQGWNDIYFNLFLPSGPKPPAGWPVAIVGHGSGGAKDPFGLNLAATMAEGGIATVIINAVGHGFGSGGRLTVWLRNRAPVTLSSGGRGIDQDGGPIGAQEGIEARAPQTVMRDRDGLRQTVVDLMQLVRVIEADVDVDGDGSPELDRSRIYYVGHSLGGMYGAQFFAVDPSVAAAVLNVPVALQAIRGNFSPVFRSTRARWLDARTPSLINNRLGSTTIGGIPVTEGPHYIDNLPLWNEEPRANFVPGAMAIQKAFENMEWAAMSGDAMAYMPHLRKAPLSGVRARPVLIQFVKGDQNVPNPITSRMLRAGDLADVTTYYLHDLAFAENPLLPKNGHGFMPTTSNVAWREIAIGAQRQIAEFFASGGTRIIHPQPARFFQVPIELPLPETFNYIR